MSEFILSEKIVKVGQMEVMHGAVNVLGVTDVKEFIEIIKAIIMNKKTTRKDKIDKINKYSGKDLT